MKKSFKRDRYVDCATPFGKYEKLKKIFFNYLDLPINTIRERMLSRGDSVDNKDYENRIESAQKEKNMKHLADFVVDATNSQEEILREVKEFILSKI